ncbi:uncharacterized protein LOC144703221 [Wolffia australiana]
MEHSGSDSTRPWPPAVATSTITADYWLNWRVFLCAFWVLSAVAIASFVIYRYDRATDNEEDGQEDGDKESLKKHFSVDDSWKPSLEKIHPACPLVFRVFAFCALSTMLIINLVVQGAEMLYFYTQWTFALVAIYFGIGSFLSCYGWGKLGCKSPRGARLDLENATCTDPSDVEHEKETGPKVRFCARCFQIIFAVSGGAVVLTDCVFWLVIVPFLAEKDYRLDFFMGSMHSINSIFLMGDVALNSMECPWFHISYFYLWTAVYVIFQWAIHASFPIWWPYPFLDLSSPYAPLWYLAVAGMHFPCFGAFHLLIKAKHHLLARWFPPSSQSRGH